MLLGIDISTTGAKALLIDEAGTLVATATTPLSLATPRPLWAEQQPEDWWAAITTSIQKVLNEARAPASAIAAIGLTGQMHGLVLLDERGVVLRPAILWNDQRTAAQCDEIRSRVGRQRLIQISGNDALTGFTAPKILWVRQHEPEVYRQVAHILLPKDYIRYRLTGQFATDCAGGSGTMLFDIRARTWSADLLAALEIPEAWLPPTYEGPAVTGQVTPRAAAETGLARGTPVVAGGGDQAAGAVGVGAVRRGILSLVLGTSGVVFAATEQPLIEPEGRLHAFCHAAPGRWHLMGVMLSAAGSLQWYRQTMMSDCDYDTLLTEAQTAPAGSGGLLFLPYLSGERTPHADPLARGAFVGLTVRHTRAHLTRAVLEGVAFGIRDNFQLMAKAGLGDIDQVRISGGGSRSSLWRQILADVLGQALVTVNTTEGAAYGAALIAAVAAGVYPSVPAACEAVVRPTGITKPGPDGALYDSLYPHYQALYPALAEQFSSLASLS